MEKYKVMIVDDEPAILTVVAELLSVYNYEILTANNGKEALALLKDHHVHLIATDYDMPLMDGKDLLTWVNGLYPSVRRVLVTGSLNRKALAEEVGKTGLAHQLLSKPCSAAKMFNTIEAELKECCLAF